MEPQNHQNKLSLLGIITLIHGSLFFVTLALLSLGQLLNWSHTLPEIMNLTCSLGGVIFSLLQIIAGSLLLQAKASARSLIDGSFLGMTILALIGLGHGLAFTFNGLDMLCLIATAWPLWLKFAIGTNNRK